jgi:hypothetical protein
MLGFEIHKNISSLREEIAKIVPAVASMGQIVTNSETNFGNSAIILLKDPLIKEISISI